MAMMERRHVHLYTVQRIIFVCACTLVQKNVYALSSVRTSLSLETTPLGQGKSVYPRSHVVRHFQFLLNFFNILFEHTRRFATFADKFLLGLTFVPFS